MVYTSMRHWLMAICGFFLAILGILYGIFWEGIFNSIIDKNILLRPNSLMFDLWKNPPLALTFDIYLFNWTNSEDLYNPDIKPNFEQLGPYRYIEKPNKVDVNFHPENASVTYKKQSVFYFDAKNSNGSLDDKIVSLNGIAIKIATQSKEWNSFQRSMTDVTFKMYGYSLVRTNTADEFLFAGFSDPLVNIASYLPKSVTGSLLPFDKVSYCYGRNSSSYFYGTINMHTGTDDISKTGKIHSWNNETTNKYFREGKCKELIGTTGEFRAPYLKPNSSIDVFLPDMCRSIPLDYNGRLEVDGVSGFEYIAGPRSVDNGTLYPENACYCNGECVPSGIMNITSCFFDVPVFVSYPHFYNADPYYLEQFTGLSPQKDKHEFRLTLDERTGLVLDVTGRLQANILIEPVPYIEMFRNVRKMYFPLIWVEVKMHVTPDLLDYLKPLPKIILSGQVFGGLLFLIGLLLVIYRPLLTLFKHGRQQTQCITIANLEKHEKHIKGKVGNMLLPEVSPLLERMRKSVILLEKKIIDAESENNAMPVKNLVATPETLSSATLTDDTASSEADNRTSST